MKNQFFITIFLCVDIWASDVVETMFQVDQNLANQNLIEALNNDSIKDFKAALEQGANINLHILQLSGWTTYLIWAVVKNNIPLVELLLQKGVDVDGLDFNRSNALMWAAENGYYELVKILIKAGAYVNGYNRNLNTAFMFAVKSNHINIANFLIQEGANINAQNSLGCTALFHAVFDKNVAMVEFLLKNKADVNLIFPEFENRNLLVLIALQEYDERYDEIVNLLLQNNINVNFVTDSGDTAIIEAASSGKKNIVKLLIDNKAKINVAKNDGITPLIGAIQSGKNDIASLLIDKGANINYRAINGWTPLMVAVAQNNLSIVRLLLQHKVQLNVVNNQGLTPFGRALWNKNLEIAKILLRAGSGLAFTQYILNIISGLDPETVKQFDELITQWNNYKMPRSKALKAILKHNKQLPSDVVDKEIAEYDYKPIPTITEQISVLYRLDAAAKKLQRVGKGMTSRKKLKHMQ